MLNLGRDWLRSYLPHCLQKIDRVTFGLLNANDLSRALALDPHMPQTRAKLAVPFVGKVRYPFFIIYYFIIEYILSNILY
jgi:hypothetical protein